MPAGRPKKEADPKLIAKLAGIGCTMKEIAAVCSCSVDTLERNFADVIEKGREEAKASLRREQFKQAMKGNTTMLIWLGKQMLEQRDKQEHTGDNGGPIVFKVTHVGRNLPPA